MEYIKLTAKDADGILVYFRKEQENENKNFEKTMKAIEELGNGEDLEKFLATQPVLDGKEKEAFKGFFGSQLDLARSSARLSHEHNVKVITRNIRLLTCGSEE